MLVFSHRSSPSHNTINTKQVFELRRNGRLDEAFEIIKEALDNRSLLEDEWILKAAVYVLTSLIERILLFIRTFSVQSRSLMMTRL